MNYSQIPSPCYVLDETLLKKNLQLIDSVRKRANVEIILAFKGFAMWSAFPILNEFGFRRATASSLAEARLAMEEMGDFAHTYSPIYTDDEIDEIAGLSSHLTFNSLSQYERFFARAKVANKAISLGLRVNPEFSEVATDLYNPCAKGSRLGITSEQLKTLPEGVEGLHFHALCESDSHDLKKVLDNFEARFGHFLPNIKWLNMGGGHLMTRKTYDVEFLIELLKNFQNKYPHLKLILEPGSAFAWETGVLVSTVEDIVENHGQKTAILDVSFTAHMPDCLEMPYKPKILSALPESCRSVLHTPNEKRCMQYASTYRIGGNSCLAGDFMGEWSFEKPLQIGDKIVFNDMIHYTMVKTTMFNGVKHPSIGIWREKTGFELVREFSYEDYRNRLS
ncbi:MAG: carboxynorspermidine decarboxylase [Bacteroidales bacterium]|jgi:carboxynorspermidine decarboxylase|nr:carboxynorspermidine decarboxylase [Bacteroidales bacterium]